MAYFYFERFILPLSHDEVVHGKATIVQKMWGGDYANKFAQVRTLYAYMMTHPGKKLNFMGNELAMFREWDETKEMDWFLLDDYEMHRCFHTYMRELNALATQNPAFYEKDYKSDGFLWIEADNGDENVYSYYRMTDGQKYAVVCNMAPVKRENFRLGLENESTITEVLNTDSVYYGGTGVTNPGKIKTVAERHNQFENYAVITLPPFGTCIFEVKETPKPVKPEKASDEKGKKEKK